MIVICVVAAVLVVGVVVLGTVCYMKSSLANAAGARSNNAGFGNPVYDASPAVFDGSGAHVTQHESSQLTAGYTDIPASPSPSAGAGVGAGAAAGYMDAAPGGQTTGHMDVAAGFRR